MNSTTELGFENIATASMVVAQAFVAAQRLAYEKHTPEERLELRRQASECMACAGAHLDAGMEQLGTGLDEGSSSSLAASGVEISRK